MTAEFENGVEEAQLLGGTLHHQVLHQVDPRQCPCASLAELLEQDDRVVCDDRRLQVEPSHDQLSIVLANLTGMWEFITTI